MVRASEIRSRVADWLQGALALEDLEEWFARNTWDVHQWGDRDVVALVHEIELRLSEHSSGHLPEKQMADELRKFVQEYSAPLEVARPQVAEIVSGTSSFTSPPVEVRFESGQLAGRRLSWECA